MTIPTSPTLDPVANGVTVMVDDADGRVARRRRRTGRCVRPGHAGRRGRRDAATAWTYKNPHGPARHHTDHAEAHRGECPNLVKFSVTGKNGDFVARSATALPVQRRGRARPAGQGGLSDVHRPGARVPDAGGDARVYCKVVVARPTRRRAGLLALASRRVRESAPPPRPAPRPARRRASRRRRRRRSMRSAPATASSACARAVRLSGGGGARRRSAAYLTPSVEAVLGVRPDLVDRGAVARKPRGGARDRARRRARAGRAGSAARRPLGVDRDASPTRSATPRHRRSGSPPTRARRLDAVRRASRDAARARVLLVVGHSPLIVAGAGTLQGELLEIAGGTNVAADVGSAWPQVSLELVVARAPDVILDAAMGTEAGAHALFAGLTTVPAVRDGRIVAVSSDALFRSGPRVRGGGGALRGGDPSADASALVVAGLRERGVDEVAHLGDARVPAEQAGTRRDRRTRPTSTPARAPFHEERPARVAGTGVVPVRLGLPAHRRRELPGEDAHLADRARAARRILTVPMRLVRRRRRRRDRSRRSFPVRPARVRPGDEWNRRGLGDRRLEREQRDVGVRGLLDAEVRMDGRVDGAVADGRDAVREDEHCRRRPRRTTGSGLRSGPQAVR